jgi:hypothetical protein
MSRVIWSKSESRQVRPFFSLEDYEHSLDAAEIRLFEGQAFSAAEAFVLQQDELRRVQPEIRFNFQEPAIGGELIKRSDLSLLVCLTAPNLKKTKILAKIPIEGNFPESLAIDPEEVVAVGGAENLVIKLGICLNRDMAPAIGRPFLAGHWVAKKFFRLRPAKETNQFDVLPRTDAEWRQHGYPEKTLYSVEYSSGMNDPVDKDSPIASVWVHADVFNRLAVDADSKKAKAVMSFLSSEIALQLITQSFQEWRDATAPTPGSPLSALIKQLSSADKLDLNKLKQLAEQPGQPKLRALVHNQQATVRALAEL